VVLDTIGGETQDRSWQVLRKGGRLVATIQPPPLEKSAAYGVEGRFVNATPDGQRLEELAQLFDSGVFQTYVETVLPLAQVADALQLSESRRARGKIVLQVRG
jgi:NADPH:quinone reductase-like Zn-dependent oxidoreductase